MCLLQTSPEWPIRIDDSLSKLMQGVQGVEALQHLNFSLRQL